MSLGEDDRVTIEAAGHSQTKGISMTVTIPQKAGFVPTPDEWAQLVRIAENLAAQVVQRDQALRQAEAERDAARAEVARLKEEVEGAYEAHDEAVTILERRLETHKEAIDAVLKALPAVAINEMEEIWGVSNTALVRKALSFLWHCAALRDQPATARARAYILRAESAEMDANKWAVLANDKANALDAARAEVARLREHVNDLADAIGHAMLYANGKTREILDAALADDERDDGQAAALRGQPAPAGGEAK